MKKFFSKLIIGILITFLGFGAIAPSYVAADENDLQLESSFGESSENPNPTVGEQLEAPDVEPPAPASGETLEQTTARTEQVAEDTRGAIESATDTGSGSGDDITNAKLTESDKKFVETIARASTYVNKIFNPAIHFFTYQIGNLMDSDYIYAGTMNDMLNNIWVTIRNIVNIIFVLVLLAIAIKEIVPFGGDEGGSDLKKVLPTFIIALVLVNFTWLGVRLVLDTASVTSNVIFSIPSGLKTAYDGFEPSCEIDEFGRNEGQCYASKVYYPAGAEKTVNLGPDDPNCQVNSEGTTPLDEKYAEENLESSTFREEIAQVGPTQTGEARSVVKDHKTNNTATICWQKMDFTAYNQNTASLFISMSMAKVQNLTQSQIDRRDIDRDIRNAETSVDLVKVAASIIFSLVFQIIYLVTFASLFIVLVFRVAILWLFIAFSPLLVLVWLLKSTGLGGDKIPDKANFGTLLRWAFAPAKVGAVWTVGFIMITSGQLMTQEAFNVFGAGGDGATRTTIVDFNSIFRGMDTMQQLMWYILTTIVIWLGTFAAMSDLEGASLITEKIKGWGNSAGAFLAKSPMYARLAPLGNKSLYHSVVKKLDIGALERKYQNDPLAESQEKFADGLAKMKKDGKDLVGHTDANRIIDALKKYNITRENLKVMLKEDKSNFQKALQDDLQLDNTGYQKLVGALEDKTPPGTVPTPKAPEGGNKPPEADSKKNEGEKKPETPS